MRRMHDILEENGSIKSIDGLPVGLSVKEYNGSADTYDFAAQEGKSYLLFGTGTTSDAGTDYDSDYMFILNYSTEKLYTSVGGKLRINIGDNIVHTNFFDSTYCVVIPLD